MDGVRVGGVGIQGVPTGVLRDRWEVGDLRVRGSPLDSMKVRRILSSD